jgi:chemotaxis protein MotB
VTVETDLHATILCPTSKRGIEKMAYGLKGGALLLPLITAGLLSGCVSQSDYDRVVAENQQLKAQNQHVNEHLEAAQAHVGRLQEAVTLVVNSDLMFKSGSWELTADGKDNIADVAKKLAPQQSQKLTIVGYTDDTPIGPALQKRGISTNQELSQKRADAVMEYMVSQGVNQNLISAQGAGEARPVAPNDSAENKAKNRRVEISLVEPNS